MKIQEHAGSVCSPNGAGSTLCVTEHAGHPARIFSRFGFLSMFAAPEWTKRCFVDFAKVQMLQIRDFLLQTCEYFITLLIKMEINARKPLNIHYLEVWPASVDSLVFSEMPSHVQWFSTAALLCLPFFVFLDRKNVPFVFLTRKWSQMHLR